jgi:hypothetical protein
MFAKYLKSNPDLLLTSYKVIDFLGISGLSALIRFAPK